MGERGKGKSEKFTSPMRESFFPRPRPLSTSTPSRPSLFNKKKLPKAALHSIISSFSPSILIARRLGGRLPLRDTCDPSRVIRFSTQARVRRFAVPAAKALHQKAAELEPGLDVVVLVVGVLDAPVYLLDWLLYWFRLDWRRGRRGKREHEFLLCSFRSSFSVSLSRFPFLSSLISYLFGLGLSVPPSTSSPPDATAATAASAAAVAASFVGKSA